MVNYIHKKSFIKKGGLYKIKLLHTGGNHAVKQWGKHFERVMTKEERDEWEKDRLFINRYKKTFNAIGRKHREYDGTDDNSNKMEVGIPNDR